MSDRLVIGIDARAAAEVPAGRGRYVRELLRALARMEGQGVRPRVPALHAHAEEQGVRPPVPRFLLYARERWDEPLDERFEWRLIDSPDPLWHLRAARAANTEAQVFLSTNSYLTAWFTRIPAAVVVYDLITFKPDARPQRRAALIEKATAGRGIRRAAALLCISDWTRADLVERFPAAAAKAVTIPLAAPPPPAIDADAAVARLGLDRPYVLAVGTLEPRKNLGRLIEAWSQLPAELRGSHTLALVGPKGWELDEVLAPVRAAEDDVRLLGFLSDDDLAAAYARCELFAYPSLYEGFGLPVLEAMQSGAPVLTSNTSSLPEVGGDAVAYVDPLSVAEIAAALERLLRDRSERERLAAAGRARAAQFSWDETARLTYDALAALV